MGDEVRSLLSDKVYKVLSVNWFNGLVQANDGDVGIDINWPSYRKVKPAKGGLGKFRRGDLVRLGDSGPWFCVAGIASDGTLKAWRDGYKYYFEKADFAKIQRKSLPTRCPSTVITKEKPGEPAQFVNILTGEKWSELPHNVPGVDKVKDILRGLVSFRSEGDVDQALRSLQGIIDGVAGLRPDLRVNTNILVGSFQGFAVSVEKVNAHIG